MNAIGYAKVSTDAQVTDAVSLDTQQGRIRAWGWFFTVRIADSLRCRITAERNPYLLPLKVHIKQSRPLPEFHAPCWGRVVGGLLWIRRNWLALLLAL